MVDEPVLLGYLDEMEEMVENGKDPEGKEIPERLKDIITNFIARQSPIKITFDVILDRKSKLITEIEKETKEDLGWIKGIPLANSINNLIESTKDMDRAGRDEITNFKWLLDALENYLIETVDENKLLKEQKSALETNLKGLGEEGVELMKSEQNLEIIKDYGESHDDVTIPEIMKITKKPEQSITIAFKKLAKQGVLEKTNIKRNNATIWRFIKK